MNASNTFLRLSLGFEWKSSIKFESKRISNIVFFLRISFLRNEILLIMALTKRTPDLGYALFAKNGFARSVREAASDRSDLSLFDLEDVIDALHSADRK